MIDGFIKFGESIERRGVERRKRKIGWGVRRSGDGRERRRTIWESQADFVVEVGSFAPEFVERKVTTGKDFSALREVDMVGVFVEMAGTKIVAHFNFGSEFVVFCRF